MKRSKKIITIVLVVLALFIVAFFLSISGEHPFLKLFLTSPRHSKLIYTNLGIKDTMDFAWDYLKKGEFVRANIAYNSVLEKDPQNVDAYIGIARLYTNIGNHGEAKKYVEKALQYIDENTSVDSRFMAYFAGGAIYNNAGNYEGTEANRKSLEYFQKALNLKEAVEDPRYKIMLSEAYYCMGIVSIAEGRFDKATEYLTKSLEYDSRDKILNFSIAISYIHMREFDKATEYLLKTEQAGKEAEAIAGYIFYYTEKGELGKASEYIEQVGNKYNDDATVQLYIANYYERVGEIDKARDMYIALFDKMPFSIQSAMSQETIERLNIDVSKAKEKIEKEKQEKYSQIIGEQKQ